MLKTKLPSSRLSLTYTFELPKPMASPSAEAHNAAVKKAAELSGLVAESVVSATASSIKSLTLSNVHELPFSSRFFVHDGGPAVRYEFFYDPDAPTMAVRIVTTLGEEPSMIIGGVLASRIAFYAMELLEGNAELSKGSPAAREGKFAPLNFGLRQQFNFLAEIIPGTLIRILYAYLSMLVDKICGIPPPADPTLVHDAKSLFRFYECPRADELAALQVYRLQPGASAPGDEKSFRKFLRLVDAWRQVRNLAGYFYLINFSPMVAPGVTDNAQDITSLESRYRGALDRPGCGPPPPLWTVSNPQLSRRLFFNNYGIHEHTFSAKPLAYVWDWLEMAAPLHGAGCITLNGVFMGWVRGMPAALAQGDFAPWMGEPVARATQNAQWFKCMGLPKSIAPKK
jgi:hypothetical protein